MKRVPNLACLVIVSFFLMASLQLLPSAEAPAITLLPDATLTAPAQHGLNKVKAALRAKGVEFNEGATATHVQGGTQIVIGSASGGGMAANALEELKLRAPTNAQALLIEKTRWRGKQTLLVCGSDARGLMYALLDVADRIGWAEDAKRPLAHVRNAREQPAVAHRALSIYTMHRATFEQRFFDEEYWAGYFDMLARNRFDSFVLIFGYENGGYFAPAYPYFFNVDGFPEMRVTDFTHEQQERYLNALKRMIALAHERGIDFTAGLWDHIYRGGVQSGGVTEADPNKPLPGVPSGLTKTNLMAYSTAALAKFLKLVPELDAVQFRMHSESGLKPGDEMREFWKSIYQVVKDVRPGLRFDARAKEFPDELIDLALDMGINIRICTKYWAEQMGMPFHPTHVNRQNQHDRRHGYADLLRYPQRYQMHWRLWNGGTTRILLWGDPEYARRFAESTHLYNGDGFEVNEMLATKMEAQPHDQPPFELLRPERRYYRWEFERYWHFYQVFGRVGYNPNTPAEVWQNEFQRRFGRDAAPHVEKALQQASWILPRINASLFPYNKFPTTRGWVEKQRWEDLAAYANCEGSDIQQFLSFAEAAKDRMEGTDSAKLTPELNSAWLDRVSREVLNGLAEAEKRVGRNRSKEFDSTSADLRILANLALYHSRRIHAGLNCALFKESQDVNALDAAIAHERHAIEAWEFIVKAADGFYTDDLMMGLRSAGLAGHWKDEVAALKTGLATLEEQRRGFQPKASSAPLIAHVPIRKVAPGGKLQIRATVSGAQPIKSVRVGWRTGSGEFKWVAMKEDGPLRYHAELPKLSRAFDYLIEAEDTAGARTMFPRDGTQKPTSVLATKDNDPPRLEHTPIVTAKAGEPLKITARVRDAAGVKWVRVLHRGVTQYDDYRALEMRPTGKRDEFEAVVPGDQVLAKWDFMYLFEVMDNNGNGQIYPDLGTETPYIVVKLQRRFPAFSVNGRNPGALNSRA